MKGLARFHSPTEVLFGLGAAGKLAEELAAIGVKRPMLVADSGALAAGLLDRALSPLRAAGISAVVFDAVRPNPTEADCRAVAVKFTNNGCDGLVAVGGGSAMDAAKCAAVLIAARAGDGLQDTGGQAAGGTRIARSAGTEARPTDFPPLSNFDVMAGGRERMPASIPPLIALPTTAGTGSEVSPAAMVQLDGTDKKIMLLSRGLIPRRAICDPEFVLSCPQWLLAGAGMDAVSHAIEVYLSPRPHPPAEAIVLDALRRAAWALPRLFDAAPGSPARRDFAAEMMLAALMAAMGFEKGVGLVHCLSHPLSALFGVHHGTANAILLPAALEFTAPAVGEKMQALGAACAAAGLANDVIAAVRDLNTRLSIPARLRDIGVGEDKLARAAELAEADPCKLTTAVRFRRTDAERMYRAVL